MILESKLVAGPQMGWCDVTKHTIPIGAERFPVPGGGESCLEHRGQQIPVVPIEVLKAGALR